MDTKLTAAQSAALKLISERGAFPKIADWVPLDEFYKFVDALVAAITPPVDSAHALHDFVTHRSAWREAILISLANAEKRDPETGQDDQAYWRHERTAYGNAMRKFDEYFNINVAEDKPVSPNACCENESRNINGGCDNCGAPCL